MKHFRSRWSPLVWSFAPWWPFSWSWKLSPWGSVLVVIPRAVPMAKTLADPFAHHVQEWMNFCTTWWCLWCMEWVHLESSGSSIQILSYGDLLDLCHFQLNLFPPTTALKEIRFHIYTNLCVPFQGNIIWKRWIRKPVCITIKTEMHLSCFKFKSAILKNPTNSGNWK